MVVGNNSFHCGYCNSKDSSSSFTTDSILGNTFTFKNCKSCNFYTISPFPSEKILARAYDETYYGTGDEKFSFPIIERILNYIKQRKVKKLHHLLNGQGKVFDIGCGNGKFLSFFEANGNYELFGLEMPGGSAERAKQNPNINLHIGTLSTETFKDTKFDLIVLTHVFEHLKNPNEYLTLIENKLAKNGILLISFPNIDSVQARLFKGKWFHMDAPKHLFFPTYHSFNTELSKRGFKKVFENHFHFEHNVFGFQQSILNVFTKKRELLYEYFKGNKQRTIGYNLKIFLHLLFVVLTLPLFFLISIFEAIIKRGGTVEFAFRKIKTKMIHNGK